MGALLPSARRILFLLAFLLVCLAAHAQDDERQLFLQAEGRFQSGNYELALDQYDAFVAAYPLSTYLPDAEFHRALCLYYSGRLDEALSLLKTIETRYSFTRYLAYVPFWIGMTDYRMGAYGAAVEAFNVYLSGSDASLSGQALLYKAISELDLGKLESARTDLVRLVGSLAEPTSIPYALAELCALDLQSGDYGAVLKLLDRAPIEKLSGDWRDRLTLYRAEAYYGTGSTAKAESLYGLLLSSAPEISGVAYERLFSIYEAEGDEARLSGVVSSAEVALSGRPDILKSFWLHVGVDSFSRGRYEVALSYLDRLWAARSEAGVSPLVPLYLAGAMAKTGRDREAAEVLAQATSPTERVSSGYRDLMLLKLGSLYLDLSEWDSAKSAFDRLLAEFPASSYASESGYLAALAAFRSGRFEASLAEIDRAFVDAQAGGYSSKLLKLKSDVYAKLGDSGRATQALEQYLPLAPEDVGARVELAKLYFEQKNYLAVQQTSARTLAAFPDLPKRDPASYLTIQYLNGLILISEKAYAQALAALEALTPAGLEASGLAVIEPYALFYRGWASYRLADYASARASFQALVSRYPGSVFRAKSYYLAGWCSYLTGDYASAERSFLTYADASVGEERDRGRYMEAKSLASGGETDAAIPAFRSLFEGEPSSPFAPDALFEYAAALAAKGDIDGASDAYRRLASTYPADPLAPQALYERADLLYRSARYDAARAGFLDYLADYPDGKMADAAVYWGGRAAWGSGAHREAALLWERLISEYRDSAFRADAMERVAAFYQSTGDLRKALELYTELASLYPAEATAVSAEARAEKIKFLLLGESDQEAGLSATIAQSGGSGSAPGRKAMVELARIYIYGAHPEKGYALLREVIAEKGGDPHEAAQAQYLVGEYFYRTGDLGRAANEFLAAATIDPTDRDLAAASMYRAAEMAKLSGDAEAASAMASRIETDFPSSEWAAEAKKLLGGAP